MILNKILEETGKQFAKKVLQHAIYEVSSNLIVRGVETAFELYKQKKLMQMSIEYQQQLVPEMNEGEYEEDIKEEVAQPPQPEPERPKTRKGRRKAG